MVTQKYTRKIWILLAESFSSVLSDLSYIALLVRWQINFSSARIGRPIKLYTSRISRCLSACVMAQQKILRRCLTPSLPLNESNLDFID